jgi:hypothetical protein
VEDGDVSFSALDHVAVDFLAADFLAVDFLAVDFLAVDEDKVTPGVLGFLVVVALGLATWFLLRSLNTQLKKVDFEERELLPGTDQGPGHGSTDVSGNGKPTGDNRPSD